MGNGGAGGSPPPHASLSSCTDRLGWTSVSRRHAGCAQPEVVGDLGCPLAYPEDFFAYAHMCTYRVQPANPPAACCCKHRHTQTCMDCLWLLLVVRALSSCDNDHMGCKYLLSGLLRSLTNPELEETSVKLTENHARINCSTHTDTWR